jgi:hypothetical protein
MSQPEFVVVLKIFISAANLSPHAVLSEFQLEQRLRVEVLGLALLALVLPEEDLAKAVIREVLIIRSQETTQLGVLQVGYTATSNEFLIIVFERTERNALKAREVRGHIDFIGRHIIHGYKYLVK